MFKLHGVFLLCLLAICCSPGLSQDCNTVKCPDIDSCPEGTEPVLLNATNSGDIYDECCEAFECKPIGCNLGSVELDSGDSISVDSCMECTCNSGMLNCSQKTCPRLNCQFSEYEGYIDGACCKTCIPRPAIDPIPPCKYGRFFVDPSNPCLSCSCYFGQTACFDLSGACPDLSNCSNIVNVQGQCCPICNATTQEEDSAREPPTGCTLSTGTKHKDGESWTEGSCKTCTCRFGEVTCTEEVCPAITCKVTETKQIPLGKCCPHCVSRLIIEPPFQPRCHTEGEYLDPNDPCKRCSCYNGLTSCIQEVCPVLPSSCSRMARVEGQCCPVCQDRNLPSAATLPHSTASSSSDSTTAQSTGVETTAMPSSDPSVCLYKGRTLQHRQRISDGPCSMCICVHGFVSCTQHLCPEIECPPFQELVYSPDQCCPKCNGSSSTTSDELLHSTKSTPSATQAARSPTASPQLSLDSLSSTLPNPVIKETIDTTTSQPTTCKFRGRTLQHEETYSSSPCSMCICLHGYVACTQHSCPDLHCALSQKLVYLPDQCCPQCSEDDSLLAHVEIVLDETYTTPTVPTTSTANTPATKVSDESPEEEVDVVGKENKGLVIGKQSEATSKPEELETNLVEAQKGKIDSNLLKIVTIGAAAVVLVAAITAISLAVIYFLKRKTKKQPAPIEQA